MNSNSDTSWVVPGAAGTVVLTRSGSSPLIVREVEVERVTGDRIAVLDCDDVRTHFLLEEMHCGGFVSVKLTGPGSRLLLVSSTSELATTAERTQA